MLFGAVGSAVLMPTRVYRSTLAFTMGFSTFLLAFVDWGALRSCNDEQSCRVSVCSKDNRRRGAQKPLFCPSLRKPLPLICCFDLPM